MKIEVDHYQCDWCRKIEVVKRWTTPEGWTYGRHSWESSDHYASPMSQVRYACTKKECQQALEKWKDRK